MLNTIFHILVLVIMTSSIAWMAIKTIKDVKKLFKNHL